ncbi:MAG: RWP-RK domain-containing protein [Methanobrevibacter sp.]|nr:RWP-RK domain-containing protein [Methanobrevibacter sp.]
MNQGFMTDIQNESQLQTTHNINIEMNPELGVGFQYQNHLQVIQRNLEGFQNPGILVENQQLLPIEATNFDESMSIFGSKNQDHVQMIQNDNNTIGFEPSSSENIAGGSGRGFRHLLSREIIAEHFNEPIEKAAKELNIGTTQLKKRCRELGINH